MIDVQSLDKLLEMIKKQDTLIFGTGYVAERFFDGLDRHGLGDRIRCFVTTKGQEHDYQKRPVISINKLSSENNESLICIATHEAILGEISASLEERGINNSIWVYPYLHELWFGKPVGTFEIEVSKIVKKWKDYRFAIRALAIDQYYGKNDCGYDIYVKTQSFHCEENTARKRLNSFTQLIESWDKNGFDSDSRPKVSEDYEVLDGAHRITLAHYHKMKTISCDVYKAENGRKFRNDEVDITDEILRNSALLPEEIDLIIETQSKYSIPDEGRE